MTCSVPRRRETARMTTWDERFGRRAPRMPTLELARTLWTMTRAPNKPITAAIYDVATGRELRVTYGDETNPLDTLLSRIGDAPLEARASELREVLESKGWATSS